MTRPGPLEEIARLATMRRAIAERRLQAAAKLERQRYSALSDGIIAKAQAEDFVADYTARRFKEAKPQDFGAGLLTSIALGHRAAERVAVMTGLQALQLATLVIEAKRQRHEAGEDLVRADRRMMQLKTLANDAQTRLQGALDEAEEEEAQDISAAIAMGTP